MPDRLALLPHRRRNPAAGMAVQKDVIRRALGRRDQDRRHAVRRHLFVGDVLRLGCELMQPLGDVPPEVETVGQPKPAGHFGVEVRVLHEFRTGHGSTPYVGRTVHGAWRSCASVESRNYVVVTRASSPLTLTPASAVCGTW